jgi:Xaa-Pro aminopeptidase
MGKKAGATPVDFIARRVEKLRAALLQAKSPALLVTNFADVSWLTGFEGDDSHAIVTPERVLLISDSRYEEQIAREAAWTTVVMRKKSIWEETARQIKRLKLRQLAVQSESLTLRGQSTLQQFLRKANTKLKLKPVADAIITLRHIKDDHEIAITEEAIRIAEGAFEALRGQIKAGMTENDIAGRLGYEMRKRGALNSSFDSIVAAGPNGSLPHYRPGEVKLQADSPLLVDWGARYKGYCSDLTRVLFFGTVSAKMREIYNIVLEAQMAGIAAIKPGVSGKKVDRAARDIIEKAGYGKEFGHGTGHGIGRDIHEAISLSKLSTTTLAPGMIVTVEPGIYLPGTGGVRIEDDVLVTETGHRVLSRLPKDLASAAL